MKTVYVGLSGGVDSSVAAALLKQQGYRVVGVHMQNWTTPVGGADCPWKQDLADARAAAAALGIAFKVFDFQTEYKAKVVDYLVAEYAAGRTPNPDIKCNQEIKFKIFLAAALADGADLIATGHYARIEDGRLIAAKDENKDQSYFLYRLSAESLSRAVFPLGELTKPEVRQLAKQLDLPTADKPDSQGICFVGEVGLKDFLRQYITTEPGPVKRLGDGQLLGQHDGAAFYTIGQRHGLGIGGGQPYYVAGKDMASNTVFVTEDAGELDLSELELTDVHWLQLPQPDRSYLVCLRHRGALMSGKLVKTDRGWRLLLEQPERAVAAGQSAVIYDGDQVIGGGVIVAEAKVLAKATEA